MTQHPGLRDGELEDLLLRAYLEVQRDQEAQGALPRSGQNVLTRFRVLFECLGAILLGLLVASFAILVNFVIVVMLLHLDVSRYRGFLFPV